LGKWRERVIQRRAARGNRYRLSDHDKNIIGRPHHLAGVSGPPPSAPTSALPPSRTATPRTPSRALSQATWVIGERFAIIERLADAGPEAL
jgi:hypothetical protein